LPIINLFMAFFSRNHIENKFSILEIYLQCDFILLPQILSVVKISFHMTLKM
jgi:hypothetical protein